MRTKHLMMAAVLPALFAACTNEELVDLNQTAPVAGLEGRQLVEGVKLSVNAAESRLAYDGKGGGYTWEANDAIGACLMDVITSDYNTINAKWSKRFDLVDYIQTNYKFSRNEAEEWCTEAKMCEGNYFFVYPYDARQGVRDAYSFNIPTQTVSGTTAAAINKAYIENNRFVGFNKIQKGASECEAVKINLAPVFGSVGFTLKNEGTNTYTIQKLVLHGSAVQSKATIDPTKCTAKEQYNGQGDDPVSFNIAQYTEDSTDLTYVKNWNSYNKDAALLDAVTYEAGAGKVTVTLTGGNVVKTQSSINVIAMVAPAKTKDKELFLDVYTDKGIIRDINLAEENTPTDKALGTVNYITTKALDEIGTGDAVGIRFDDTSINVPSEVEVKDNNDLAMLIHWNAGIKKNIKATLQSDATITKAMVEELNKSQITKVTIEGDKDVILDADVVGALDSKFEFNANVVIAAGEHAVTAKTKAAKITVNKGATLNVNATNAIAITNKGTLNLNAENKKSITNDGVATVAADKKAADITNNATLTNNGTIVKLTNNAGATVNNAGTINAGTNAAADSEKKKSAAVINNSGSAMIENKGSIVMATADAKLQATGDGEVDNTILSSTIKAATNTIFVTLKDVTATKVNEVIASSGATKLVLSGTVTNDEVDKEGNPVDVNFKNIKKVVAAANLTFNGKSKVRLSDDTNGAELIVNPGVVVTIESGATVATGKGSGKVTFIPDNNKGKLVIKTGAVFYTQEVDENQVENYGELSK